MSGISKRTVCSSPIRIAHIMGKMVGGGLESVVLNYWDKIDKSRFQFDFIVDKDSTYIPYSRIEAGGGKIIMVDGYQHQPANMNQLERLFENHRYPIVHSHLNALSVFSLRSAKRAGVPVRIAHSHSTAGKGEFVRNSIKRQLKLASNVYPTHRMACSKHAGEWLFGKHREFTVLYNAIDLSNFVFSVSKRRDIRSELMIPGDAFVIGHIGRFVPQKNHQFVLKVFQDVIAIEPRSRLVLIGTGKLQPAITSAIERNGLAQNVIMLDQRSDIGAFYSAFDAFILPSLYEGLGMVAIEAQCAGLPCFLSSRVPEETAVTQLAKYISLDSGSEVWAQRIINSCYGVRSQLSGCELEAIGNYDIQKAVKKLEQYYSNAIQ